MTPGAARREIRNVFGMPPGRLTRQAPRPKPALRRAKRADWPDLDELLARARPPQGRRRP